MTDLPILEHKPEVKEEKTDKKPVVVFTTASKPNLKYAIPLIKSLRKFHDWPIILYTDETNPDLLPKNDNITIADLTPYMADPQFFYRQKPILSEPLLDEYELVIGMDSDQLVLGDLSYALETKDYDIATVLNANRFDTQFYPVVDLQRIGIFPIEYFNAGTTFIRSKKFAHIWQVNCFTPQFERMQYREQDILNIMCYFGNWNIRCLDLPDPLPENPNHGFWGLISKGELTNAFLKDDKIMIPKGEGETPFPPEEKELKIVHMAGGQGVPKDNWGAFFSPEVMDRINELTK